MPRDFEDDLETSVVILAGSAEGLLGGLRSEGSRAHAARGGCADRRAQRSSASNWAPRCTEPGEDMDQVTIAAIEAHCIGGGARPRWVALSTSFPREGRTFPHSRGRARHEHELGVDLRMLALMGPARTKQAVILAPDRIPAADALAWGLVEKVVDDGQALTAAMEFAERIAKQPPIPVRMTKTMVNRVTFVLHDLGSHMDAEQNVLTGLTEDYKEGTSAFREQRKPTSGRALGLGRAGPVARHDCVSNMATLPWRSGLKGRVSKGGQQHNLAFPPSETHRYAMLLRVRWCWVCYTLADAPLEWRAPSPKQSSSAAAGR